jgi:ABC-2 type transport system ATP-binding protein
MPQIEVDSLCKTFRVPEREGGLLASLRSVFRRKYRQVNAVDRVSFTVDKGEIVGFWVRTAREDDHTQDAVGVVAPDVGMARHGACSWKRQADYLRRISMLMGQRTQMQWDLPAIDSFMVHGAVYNIPKAQYQETLDELVELLDLTPILKKQVRTLSLGERMKCEICVSLLHRPAVLFLDEPTIGVDVTMQARIREFIAGYNKRHGATIILTSHYMADVVALCKRIIVIHHGRILFDGALDDLSAKLAPFKVIKVDLDRELDGYDFAALGEVILREARKVELRVPKRSAPTITERLLNDLPILDLTIEDPPIEDVIKRAFSDATPAGEGPDAAVQTVEAGRT